MRFSPLIRHEICHRCINITYIRVCAMSINMIISYNYFPKSTCLKKMKEKSIKKKRRSFIDVQKLSIVMKIRHIGISVTARKRNIQRNE